MFFFSLAHLTIHTIIWVLWCCFCHPNSNHSECYWEAAHVCYNMLAIRYIIVGSGWIVHNWLNGVRTPRFLFNRNFQNSLQLLEKKDQQYSFHVVELNFCGNACREFYNVKTIVAEQRKAEQGEKRCLHAIEPKTYFLENRTSWNCNWKKQKKKRKKQRKVKKRCIELALFGFGFTLIQLAVVVME